MTLTFIQTPYLMAWLYALSLSQDKPQEFILHMLWPLLSDVLVHFWMNNPFKTILIGCIDIFFVDCWGLIVVIFVLYYSKRYYHWIFSLCAYCIILTQIFHETPLSTVLFILHEWTILRFFNRGLTKMMILIALWLFQDHVKIDFFVHQIFSDCFYGCWQLLIAVLKKVTPLHHRSGLFNKSSEKMIEKFSLFLISFDIFIHSQ